MGRNSLHETCICGSILPLCQGRATGLVCAPSGVLPLLLLTEESWGLALGRKGALLSFPRMRDSPARRVFPGARRNTGRVVPSQTSETCTTGPTPAMPGTGTGVFSAPGCPVNGYIVCSCITCVTDISVLENESDCGEPRLPLGWKLSLAWLAAIRKAGFAKGR